MIAFWGAIVVLGSIAAVAWPLLRRNGGASVAATQQDSQFSELLAQKDSTLMALSELESDFELGSLSRTDYQELKGKYEEKAVALIKTTDAVRAERRAAVADEIDDEIEKRVANLRSAGVAPVRATPKPKVAPVSQARICPECGTRAAADHEFCFKCGAALVPRCAKCAAEIRTGDAFCSKCGAQLGTFAPERG